MSNEDLRLALYFGCLGPHKKGHYLHHPDGRSDSYPKELVPGFLWGSGELDGGLLKNGKREDIYDGRVFWTFGRKDIPWFAFFWWDRSADSRGASNSGFYVRGFEFADRDAAFEYAKGIWPKIVERQKFPLIIQEKLVNGRVV